MSQYAKLARKADHSARDGRTMSRAGSYTAWQESRKGKAVGATVLTDVGGESWSTIVDTAPGAPDELYVGRGSSTYKDVGPVGRYLQRPQDNEGRRYFKTCTPYQTTL
jgi:hypothetical protein